MTPPEPKRSSQWFTPILAGATWPERMLACLGALVAISLTGMLCGVLLGYGPHLPLIVAPIGASAVLLFAVPASPLAQPWSVIGGNTLSAAVGVAAAMAIPDPVVASGIAVALAIAAMSLTRCLHPPGGAAALTAVLGGSVVADWGMLFPLVPVGLNSCLLVSLGVLFHRLSGRNYPHKTPPPPNRHLTADPPPAQRSGFRDEDVEAALATINETFDIASSDLTRLLRQVELEAIARSSAEISCGDIMSRDVVSIDVDATAEEARRLLLDHEIRTLPVTTGNRLLAGTLGLRELAMAPAPLRQLSSRAATARAGDPAFGLLSVLTNGRHHAVIIVDDENRVVGLISQTDLLGVVARALPVGS